MDGIYSRGGYGVWMSHVTEDTFRISTGPSCANSAYGKNGHGFPRKCTGCARIVLEAPSSDSVQSYSSGWIPLSSGNHVIRNHGLGDQPSMVTIWGINDDGMYLMDGIYSSGGHGTWMTRITDESFRVSSGPKCANSGYGKDSHVTSTCSGSFHFV